MVVYDDKDSDEGFDIQYENEDMEFHVHDNAYQRDNDEEIKRNLKQDTSKPTFE